MNVLITEVFLRGLAEPQIRFNRPLNYSVLCLKQVLISTSCSRVSCLQLLPVLFENVRVLAIRIHAYQEITVAYVFLADESATAQLIVPMDLTKICVSLINIYFFTFAWQKRCAAVNK